MTQVCLHAAAVHLSCSRAPWLCVLPAARCTLSQLISSSRVSAQQAHSHVNGRSGCYTPTLRHHGALRAHAARTCVAVVQLMSVHGCEDMRVEGLTTRAFFGYNAPQLPERIPGACSSRISEVAPWRSGALARRQCRLCLRPHVLRWSSPACGSGAERA